MQTLKINDPVDSIVSSGSIAYALLEKSEVINHQPDNPAYEPTKVIYAWGKTTRNFLGNFL